MALHKALHPIDEVEGYMNQKKEEGRSLAGTEDSADASIQLLEN